MMTVTLLNDKNFAKIEGKEKYLHAGLGVGRNVMYWKQDSQGNIFARLSPIADPIYDGTVKVIKDERFESHVLRLFA